MRRKKDKYGAEIKFSISLKFFKQKKPDLSEVLHFLLFLLYYIDMNWIIISGLFLFA